MDRPGRGEKPTQAVRHRWGGRDPRRRRRRRFQALHSNRQNDQVQLCAFDVLAVDGEDVRDLPLSMRKANLDRLFRGRSDGIFVNPFEIGAIGPELFRAACNLGLEGLVSKRSDRPYRGGRSPHWVKVKNRSSPAMNRAAEVNWSR